MEAPSLPCEGFFHTYHSQAIEDQYWNGTLQHWFICDNQPCPNRNNTWEDWTLERLRNLRPHVAPTEINRRAIVERLQATQSLVPRARPIRAAIQAAVSRPGTHNPSRPTSRAPSRLPSRTATPSQDSEIPLDTTLKLVHQRIATPRRESTPLPQELSTTLPAPEEITVRPPQQTDSEPPSSNGSPNLSRSPSPSAMPEENTRTAERKIRQPPDFTGDRLEASNFLNTCRTYLRINKNAYTTDEDKIIFVLSFMKGGNSGTLEVRNHRGGIHIRHGWHGSRVWNLHSVRRKVQESL